MPNLKPYYQEKSYQAYLLLAGFLLTYALYLVPAILPASQDYPAMSVESSDVLAVVRAFFDLIGGRPPAYSPYGQSVAAILAFVLLPLAFLFSVLGVPLGFAGYVILLKLAHLGVAILAVLYSYRLAKLYTGSFWALFVVPFLCSSYAFAYWTVILKPDIWLLTFVLMSSFYMSRALRGETKNILSLPYDLWVAAILGGLAFGSKIWGVFIAPSLVATLLILAKLQNYSWRQTLRALLTGVVIFVVGAFIGMPHLFVQFRELTRLLRSVSEHQNTTPHLLAAGALFTQKIQTLISGQFLGPALFLILVGLSAWLFFNLVHRRARHILQRWPLPLLIFQWTYLFFYFFLYRDTFNIYGGERNVISIVLPSVVSGVIASFYLVNLSRIRFLFVTMSFVLFGIFPFLAGAGIIAFFWRPLPQIIHNDNFKQLLATSGPDVQMKMRGFYANEFKGTQWILRDLNENEIIEVENILEKSGNRIPMHWGFFNTAYSIAHLRSLFVTTELRPKFAVRKWIAENVAPHSLVLHEFYLYLQSSQCYSPVADLPEGTRLKMVSADKMFLTRDEIIIYQPDYAVTASAEVAYTIVREVPQYSIIKSFSDQVFVLAKTWGGNEK